MPVLAPAAPLSLWPAQEGPGEQENARCVPLRTFVVASMAPWRTSEALQRLASKLLLYTTPSCTPRTGRTGRASPARLPPRVPALSVPSCCSSAGAMNYPHLPHTPTPPRPPRSTSRWAHLGISYLLLSDGEHVANSCSVSAPHSAWHRARARAQPLLTPIGEESASLQRGLLPGLGGCNFLETKAMPLNSWRPSVWVCPRDRMGDFSDTLSRLTESG